MIVVMDLACSTEEIEHASAALKAAGVSTRRAVSDARTTFVAGSAPAGLAERMRSLPGVATVVAPADNLRLTSRDFQAKDTVVDVAGVRIGDAFVVAAGPCAVESESQLEDTARMVALAGGMMLRGGAYKPRTSPYSFQGLGREGLELLAEQRRKTGLPVVTEVLDTADLDSVLDLADMVQIGTRNAQNYALLREVGRSERPVLLKRGMASTVEEWLLAAEYVLAEGNPNVVLCERGIRSFESATRFTLDLSAVPVVNRLSHLPVLVDPSHAAGRADLVAPLALAAAAVGADGLLLDVHVDASTALCDAGQALDHAAFGTLMKSLGGLLGGLRRPLAGALGVPSVLTAEPA